MAASAFRLEGSSMSPVFKSGEVVLVSSLSSQSSSLIPHPSSLPIPPSLILSSGDCAVYSYNGTTLLHRVIKTASDGVWLADDAGRLAPHFVLLERIRGRVLSRNPFAGGICGRIYSAIRRRLSPYKYPHAA
ncbi:MAG: hypothetical protein A2X28_04770 [Elusimicrobia bacterium GWA2_56_46]|nr:MAG: hypothetical protein A2X28_04770 [Elusimicrobia bacterium GWA2_56_46]OGR56184.1 MAG: hypothetical protein A2X39_08190 [Elusimicrobia bacterium GWC2_56_31]HBB66901.1 hypothetical protein [Elusimicrobiota bacterium]HBW23039.1 hypothetical protein [Elusimicrobiota bacterium]